MAYNALDWINSYIPRSAPGLANPVIESATEPEGPHDAGQRWRDTSLSPPALFGWDGSQFVALIDAENLRRIEGAAADHESRVAALESAPGGGDAASYGIVLDAPQYTGNDATQDASTHFETAFQEAVASRVAAPDSSGKTLGIKDILIPGGNYLITSESAMMAPPNSRTWGLRFRSLGGPVYIYFKPSLSGDRYLMTNDEPGWLIMDFEGITFTFIGAGASFMRSTSNGGPQNARFDRCMWISPKYGFRLQGTNNNGDMDFIKCGTYGEIEDFLWAETNDQFLSYNFFAHNHEVERGSLLRMTKGGDVNVMGGRFIYLPFNNDPSPPTTEQSTFLKLEGTGHFTGVTRFKCLGSRFERRHANNRLIDCEWDYGTVSFDSIDDGAFWNGASGGAPDSAIAAAFGSDNAPGLPKITFRDSMLGGRHEYRYHSGNAANDTGPQDVLYEQVEVNHDNITNFFVFTPIGAHANAGSIPPIKCAGLTPLKYSSTRHNRISHATINWQNARRGQLEKRVEVLQTQGGTNPGSNSTESLVLEPGAIITSARLYAPPGGSSTSTNWIITLRDAANNTLVQAAGGGSTQLQAGFNALADDLWHVGDTLNRRTIVVASNAQVNYQNPGFIAVIEGYW